MLIEQQDKILRIQFNYEIMPPKKKAAAPKKDSKKETTIDLASTNAVDEVEAVEPNEQLIFHDYDFTNFWVNCKYSRDYYVEKVPTANQIVELEETLGYKLPKAYIELCQKTQNGGMVKKIKISTGKPKPHNHVYINSIFSIGNTKTYSLGGHMGSKFWVEEWGYPTIGIYFADCPSGGHDMLCLDYSRCGPQGEPQVVRVDQEGDYRKTVVAQNFEAFIRKLEHCEMLGIPPDDIEEEKNDADEEEPPAGGKKRGRKTAAATASSQKKKRKTSS